MSNLPKGWELVQFDKVCDIRDGTHDSPKYIENGIPFITSKHLTDNGIDFTETNYISEENHIEFSKRSKVDNGDILFGMIGTIGKPVIVNTDFEFSIKNVALLKLSSNELLSNIYVLNLLKSNIIINQFSKLSNGGVQSFIALGMIRKLKIPLPPLEEQKKIADILSTVDKKIAFVEENINATEELKKGLMQKLLTEGIGHTEFKDSELGRIPESWKVVKLEEVCTKIVGGGTPSKNEPDYWNNGTIPWVTPSEFTKSKSNYISVTESKISEEGLKNSSATLLAIGTVIMSSRATIGECKINTIEITTNQGFISFQCNDLLNNLYLLYFIKQNKPNILKISSGSTFLEVSRTSMKNFSIAIPPLEEQKQIAEILSTVDKKLENLKEKKQSFEELKKGLMQKLLTGEVRV
jgi:type I restriction enzyme, S subunit